MKNRELANLGIPKGETMRLAGTAVQEAIRAGKSKKEATAVVRAVVANPQDYVKDAHFGQLAAHLAGVQQEQNSYSPRQEPAPYQIWGENLDHQSLQQMENACALPVAARGALMPDAHVGYGLPIGGVLATRRAVIPYAVGVDIACRMKLSVLDLSPQVLHGQRERLIKVLERETKFGVGATFRQRREHAVLDEDWSISKVVGSLQDKAWAQLGTSGSGNHFVEYGLLTVENKELGLEPGEYLAILSHSGSRGAGATIAGHYSRLAMDQHPELPQQLRHLAWLDLYSEAGQEYWRAMNLMGQYASANHALIHKHMVKELGTSVLLDVENHHNFAWLEEHDGESFVVHRKGATPAGAGVIGIIPGTMATPAFIVRGKGNPASLNSAAHGAGRQMSRKAAKEKFTWSEVKKFLKEQDVELLTAGLDEAPMAYKDIHEVMAAQQDLVETMARFQPKIVKMAPAGERPED